MFNSILTGLVAGSVVLAGLLLTGLVCFQLAKRKIRAFFEANFLAPDKDTPSSFAVLVSTIAGTFGSEIAGHLKAVFLGLQSVEAKNGARAAAAATIGDSPVLGAIVSSFPAVGKKLMKNPAMASLADMVLGKVLAGKNNQSPAPQDNGGRPVQFTF